MDDDLRRKGELLAVLMGRYFGETCPALMKKWDAAIPGLAPPFLRELSSQLRVMAETSDQVNRQLRADRRSSRPIPARESLDRALAEMERLNEIADALMVRLDELLKSS